MLTWDHGTMLSSALTVVACHHPLLDSPQLHWPQERPCPAPLPTAPHARARAHEDTGMGMHACNMWWALKPVGWVRGWGWGLVWWGQRSRRSRLRSRLRPPHGSHGGLGSGLLSGWGDRRVAASSGLVGRIAHYVCGRHLRAEIGHLRAEIGHLSGPWPLGTMAVRPCSSGPTSSPPSS